LRTTSERHRKSKRTISIRSKRVVVYNSMALVINEWLINMSEDEEGCTAEDASNFIENLSPMAKMVFYENLYQMMDCPEEGWLLKIMETVGLGAAAEAAPAAAPEAAPEAAPAKKASKCVFCKKRIRKTEKEPGQWVRGRRCGKCVLVVYCGKECQAAHWPVHQKECTRSVLPDSKQ
jgi:hypothetical protein